MNTQPLIILAAHGAGDSSPANQRIAELARFVAERRHDAEIIATFNLGSPGLPAALAGQSGRPIVILPLMTSAGYFAGEHLLQHVRAAGLDSPAVTIADAVGVGTRARNLLARRAQSAATALDPSATTIIVVGHGTRRSPHSGAATLAVADTIRESLPAAQVLAAFLDQDPLLEQVSAGALRDHVIVAPFLIGGGEHARADIPQRLGIADREPDAAGFRHRDDGRRVQILAPLGEDDDFPAILLEALDTAHPRPIVRLGTRSSPLALWQADAAASALESAGAQTYIVTIDSDGDQDLFRPIDAFPTDGPFTDALERALLAGKIDAAVHSMKDLPLTIAPGTTLAAVLPRGSAAEALVSRDGLSLNDFPPGATIGTCSQRRAAQIRRLRPDLLIAPIRGTIDQRLAAIHDGKFDATVLAVAGLERLGIEHEITQRFTPDELLPEAAQGAIAIQVRTSDQFTTAIVAAANDPTTHLCVTAERLFTQLLSKQTGLIAAALATHDDGLRLRGRALSLDGAVCIDIDHRSADPATVARETVAEIVARIAVRSPSLREGLGVGSHGSERGNRAFAHAPARVALVGAGPGDPGLITVRGLALLRQANVVVYDRLIDPSLLDEAPADAERIDASKSPGHHTLTQDQINAVIVDRALRGKRVVRLKGGDPFVFGRGSEELRACRRAGIACEVVSGVTSAIAAPAAAGIPVTARGVARTLAIVTPQTEGGAASQPLDYHALARLDTVVVLMARGLIAEVAHGLIRAGRSPHTPAAVIQDGTLPTQRQVIGRLEDIAELADQAGLRAPAVFVIGETVGLHADLAEAQPGRLHGKRIVVTRPTSASPDLISMLRAEGASIINCPLIRIEYQSPPDFSALQHAHDWTVFTSLHAVRGFWRTLRSLDRDARAIAPPPSRVAAVGPKTAQELLAIGITPDLVPTVHRASALIESLASHSHKPGQRILFPCGTLARDELRAGLRARGMVVDELVVYQTLLQRPSPEALADIRAGERVDAILLYCPSAALSAADAGLLSHDTTIACIGPTTAAAVRDRGFTAQVVPDTHTDAGLIDALAEHFQQQRIPQGAAA